MRYELRQLQNEYRILANDPVDIHLIQIDIISNVLPGAQEQNVKQVSNLAKARVAHSKANQSKIDFLDDPVKGRVKTNTDMINTAMNYLQIFQN